MAATLGTDTIIYIGNTDDTWELLYFNVPTISAGTWQNWLWSIDSETGIFQIYVNDVPLTPATEYDSPSTYIDTYINTTADTAFSVGYDTQNTPSESGCQGDVYFTISDAFYDLSVEANRRVFIDTNGNPVNSGTNGSIPTGSPPLVFFTVPPGSAASSFLTNRGSGGGSWEAQTTAAFCSTHPPDSWDVVANLDVLPTTTT